MRLSIPTMTDEDTQEFETTMGGERVEVAYYASNWSLSGIRSVATGRPYTPDAATVAALLPLMHADHARRLRNVGRA